MARSIRRPSLGSWIGAAVGAELMRCGVTGHPLFGGHAREIPDRHTRLSDKVDLGSDLSFPASDPPAY